MKKLICIVCPKGCHLTVDEQNDFKVSGNECPRGESYAKSELLHPCRTVTSTVSVEGGIYNRCPVKTSDAIPKEMIMKVMQALSTVKLSAPIKKGQTVLENVCGCGACIVTTRSMPVE